MPPRLSPVNTMGKEVASSTAGPGFRPTWRIRLIVAIWLSLTALLAPVPEAFASPADSAWQRILALDSGPGEIPRTPEQARLYASNHLLTQKNALDAFVNRYPGDPRVPEARLRLASILATEGRMEENSSKIREAFGVLQSIEKNPSASPKVKSDAAFRMASIRMQNAPGGPEAGYKYVVKAATDFVRAYPDDRRGPRLLVEAGTVCDSDPDTKRKLLDEARKRTSEEDLLRRIDDDLKRLSLIGKPVEIKLRTLSGQSLDLSDYRGKPVLLIFWAAESPQSLFWLRDFARMWQTFRKKADFAIVTVNLDSDPAEARERAALLGTGWPVGYEPGGWDAPTARRLGINALPTVWVLDSQGRLRTLNAKSTWRQWVGILQREGN